MTKTTDPTPAIAVRTCAAILRGDEICLIHRRRPGGDQYSLPGGLLYPDEEASAGLARELKEELDLVLQPHLENVASAFVVGAAGSGLAASSEA
ncbi:NUDIX domain-containing protein [Streptomyces sp. NPDC005065]|uniref:NUDIX hydrolase n=1 Tax=Streptomyces sp. NPDC005065 TaxID=3154461 RepID=UPI00339DFA9F